MGGTGAFYWNFFANGNEEKWQYHKTALVWTKKERRKEIYIYIFYSDFRLMEELYIYQMQDKQWTNIW